MSEWRELEGDEALSAMSDAFSKLRCRKEVEMPALSGIEYRLQSALERFVTQRIEDGKLVAEISQELSSKVSTEAIMAMPGIRSRQLKKRENKRA